jgi:hypothetical protein
VSYRATQLDLFAFAYRTDEEYGPAAVEIGQLHGHVGYAVYIRTSVVDERFETRPEDLDHDLGFADDLAAVAAADHETDLTPVAAPE